MPETALISQQYFSYENKFSFTCKENSFHIKGFVFDLDLKQRQTATRKLPHIVEVVAFDISRGGSGQAGERIIRDGRSFGIFFPAMGWSFRADE